MSSLTRLPLWTWSVLALPALAALLAGASGRRDRPPPGPSPLEGWDVPRLAAELDRAGLGLRVVPTAEGGDVRHNAFLTTTDQGWERLTCLPKLPEHIHRWRGTAYVEVARPGSRAEAVRQWRECSLRAGPFVFFGDPDPLDRVRQALPAGAAAR
jgi:hypothetical protein